MRAPTDPAADTTSDVHVTDPGAASPVGDTAPPVPSRLMIAVSDLTAHPGNVREDLNLTGEFVASVAAEGVRMPLLITTGPDGGWRVIEGHRRLAAAIEAGLAEVPCDIDPGRAGDGAGQYVDMLLANSDSYRSNYTAVEEAAALFAAHEAGASRTRLRKATGRTAAQVKTALAAGSLTADTRVKAAEATPDVTLEDLAILSEFDGDDAATERLLMCLQNGYALEHAAERIRADRAEAAEHDKLRAELDAVGVPVTDSLPDGAAWLTSLTHDGQDLTPDSHAACPGHGATFPRWNLLEPSYYCTSPAEQGHASRWQLPSSSATSGGGASSGVPGALAPADGQAPDPGRRLVISGNKAWQAAAEVRHRWLTANLFARRTGPREFSAFVAAQLLTMPEPLRAGLASAAHRALFAKLTGHDAAQMEQSCDTATAGRLSVVMLAPIVTAYEYAMTEGEGRSTWRTDRYSPCPRRDAGRYLTFLASAGYQLSAIEQAVADGVPYTGDTPESGLLADSGSESDDGISSADGHDTADQPGKPDDIGDEAAFSADVAA